MNKLLITAVLASFSLSGCAVIQTVGEAAWQSQHYEDCRPSLGDPVAIDPPGCNVPPPLKDDEDSD